MAAIHKAEWAVRRPGFWEDLGDMFAAPFLIIARFFDPEGERNRVLERINRDFEFRGLAPVDLDADFEMEPEPESNIVRLAWRDVAQDFWRAFEYVEREYASQIDAAARYQGGS